MQQDKTPPENLCVWCQALTVNIAMHADPGTHLSTRPSSPIESQH